MPRPQLFGRKEHSNGTRGHNQKWNNVSIIDFYWPPLKVFYCLLVKLWLTQKGTDLFLGMCFFIEDRNHKSTYIIGFDVLWAFCLGFLIKLPHEYWLQFVFNISFEYEMDVTVEIINESHTPDTRLPPYNCSN